MGFVLGATISALFAEHAWWPWSYWLTGIIAAVVSLCGVFAVPSSPSQFSTPKPKPSWIDALWATDTPAGALGITSLVFFNLAWNQAVVTTWSAPYIPAFLVLGILLCRLPVRGSNLESKATSNTENCFCQFPNDI